MEARVRLRKPDRAQVTMRVKCDDQLIPAVHQARVIWSMVEKLDLSALHEPIAGRSSFRRGGRLDQARAHMAELRSLLDDPEKSAGLSAKKKAASP
jgi:hypothetical protein